MSSGDLLLVFGLPGQFQLGCDTMAMTVPESRGPPALTGIRGLPPGAHFIWISSPGALSRQGCWFFSKPAAVVRIKRWDRYHEILSACASQEDACSLASKSGTCYQTLLPYGAGASNLAFAVPERTHSCDLQIWPRLTSCITKPLLDRVVGGSRTTDSFEWLLTTSDTARGETSAPGVSGLEAPTEFVFLFPYHDIDPYQFLASSTPASHANGLGNNEDAFPARNPTSLMPDIASSIITLLENPGAAFSEDDIVGELQFAFLTGTLISNLSCLEQWWHLVLKVFLRAYRLVIYRPRLVCSLVHTFHDQLLYLDRHVVGGLSSVLGATQNTEEDDGGSIFDVKPHGAFRLQTALSAYRRLFKDMLMRLDRPANREQVAADQAFAQLEAWLWQRGWDLRGDTTAHNTLNVDNKCEDDNTNGNDSSKGNLADCDDKRHTRSSQTLAYMPLDLQLDSDDEDEQPIFIEFDDNGKEIGLVSWL